MASTLDSKGNAEEKSSPKGQQEQQERQTEHGETGTTTLKQQDLLSKLDAQLQELDSELLQESFLSEQDKESSDIDMAQAISMESSSCSQTSTMRLSLEASGGTEGAGSVYGDDEDAGTDVNAQDSDFYNSTGSPSSNNSTSPSSSASASASTSLTVVTKSAHLATISELAESEATMTTTIQPPNSAPVGDSMSIPKRGSSLFSPAATVVSDDGIMHRKSSSFSNTSSRPLSYTGSVSSLSNNRQYAGSVSSLNNNRQSAAISPLPKSADLLEEEELEESQKRYSKAFSTLGITPEQFVKEKTSNNNRLSQASFASSIGSPRTSPRSSLFFEQHFQEDSSMSSTPSVTSSFAVDNPSNLLQETASPNPKRQSLLKSLSNFAKGSRLSLMRPAAAAKKEFRQDPQAPVLTSPVALSDHNQEKALKLLGIGSGTSPSLRKGLLARMAAKRGGGIRDADVSVTVLEALESDPLVAGFLKDESLKNSYYCLTFDTLYQFRSNYANQKSVAMIPLDSSFSVDIMDTVNTYKFKLTSLERGITRVFYSPASQELKAWVTGFNVAFKSDLFSHLDLPCINIDNSEEQGEGAVVATGTGGSTLISDLQFEGDINDLVDIVETFFAQHKQDLPDQHDVQQDERKSPLKAAVQMVDLMAAREGKLFGQHYA